MMLDGQAHFGQFGVASPFAQPGLFGTVPGQYGQVIGQAIAACLGSQVAGAIGQPGRFLPLEAALAMLAPAALAQQGVFGVPALYGQGLGQQAMGGWLGQPQLGGFAPQGLFGGLVGPYAQPITPGIGGWVNHAQFAGFAPQSLFGTLAGPYGPPIAAIGGWPVQTQLGTQLGGAAGRSFLPYQLTLQPAYAG